MTGGRRGVAMGVVLAGMSMSNFDITVVNVAVAPLQRAFGNAAYQDVAWVVTVYTLSLGAVTLLTGWLADRLGRQRTYTISLITFTAASAICAAAPTLGVLIIARALQGIGGGILIPLGTAIVVESHSPAERVRMNLLLGAPLVVAPSLGPVLGGWLVQTFSWRMVFLVNVPAGVVAVLLSVLLLGDDTDGRRRGGQLDVRGIALSVPAVVAVLFALNRAATEGLTSPSVLVPAGGGVVLGAVFILAQRRTEDPVVQLRLLRDDTFARATVLAFALSMVMFTMLFLAPTYAQAVHGVDVLGAGILIVPQGVFAAVGTPLASVMTARLGTRTVVLAGVTVMVVSSALLAFAANGNGVWLVALCLGLRGFALACAMVPAITLGVTALPRGSAAHATTITQSALRVGASLGVALFATVLAAQQRHTSLESAYSRTFVILFALTAACLVPVLALPRRPRAGPAVDEPATVVDA